MTAPFKYKSAPYTKYFSSENWVKSALDLLGGKGEIGQFRYTPLIGPDILSGILTSVTGQSALAFAEDALIAPLSLFQNRYNLRSGLICFLGEGSDLFEIIQVQQTEGYVIFALWLVQ